VPDSYRRVNFRGLDVAWFILEEVGEPYFHYTAALNDQLQILKSLSFFHSRGFLHGDARFRNVVKICNPASSSSSRSSFTWKWIDIRTLQVITTQGIIEDFTELFSSLKKNFDRDFLAEYAILAFANTWTDAMREAKVEALFDTSL
jgi:hypothetical protein